MAEKKIKKEKIDNVGIHSFSKKQISSLVPFLVWVALSCILPFVFVIVISVTDEKSILQNGYSFFPSQFGLDGFEFLAQFKDKILQASSSQSCNSGGDYHKRFYHNNLCLRHLADNL